MESLFSEILEKSQIKLVITTERKVSFLDEFNTHKEYSLPVDSLDSVSAARILKILAKNKDVNLGILFPTPELEKISSHQLFNMNHNITPGYITEIVNLMAKQYNTKSIMNKMVLYNKRIERQIDNDYWSVANKIISSGFENLAQKIEIDNIFHRLQNFILFACFFRYG